ncbi:endonuclease/exonuclease/phosphatase family protein [Bifidobacterium aerophilum]|uniref:Endonuclease/exonuclease/phosphatase family protein n=1 Tax=Bifidobacterium aerophilum TaxID=1798155 RepID=A0A6N9Z3C5_9BIFI|nr:endonuclease/exonuclease/phosphatase family protein [Bifidobacterium aerophilum]NEG88930.1 endonuclease/exonuclease/phosphatase family protein [Bifidobacterium aerophilum]
MGRPAVRSAGGSRAGNPRIGRLVAGWTAWALAVLAAVAVVARALPADLQALPYVPVLVSVTPWFALVAVVALVLALMGRRWVAALVAVLCLAVQVWWQYPFFEAPDTLPAEAETAVSGAAADTSDRYARVMTCNVYRGQADAKAIVELVRDQRVEVLALQETTDAFVEALDAAGIKDYLPYMQVSTSDGVYGNGLWSAAPLSDPADDEVNSSASFMPGGTVTFGDENGGALPIRFVSVHTTSPKPGYWTQWKRSLDELALMRSRTDARYVFMGDFNATYDHASFRRFLGDRFSDAARQSGHGFTFTWPADLTPLPRFAGIDHIVLDRDIVAGQMQVKRIAGSDHAALLATIAVK